ncbi:Asp23/Gls24 family envelope stress response protein [Actinacidiphila sp. ITFR-21]|uniref:Asp23/Gls24 family envelope stress response protein n=1 Tax=Actinacidiphila sp. ITFR-21 TaxID=3075199 RepID=UPI002889E557|nr:Asp23/Gls24 family envelope stress response protein [Streptomyces sp. ITFR-21]WNI14961.1 Asp23/Gls24 family envelope stress response protein [Streptomyces sp. ITFR-21]
MAAPAVPAQLPPADRGSLRIADRVIARIAAHAATEVLATAPGAELVPPEAAPHATVSVRRNTARLRLTLELGYPADLGSVSASVRRHVTGRVEAMTGMAVPEVAVEIERLHSATARRNEEGRVR